MRTYLIIFLLLSVALISGCEQEKKLPRVAICGLAIESSTFSPAQSNEESFRVRHGQDVFTYYPFLSVDSVDRKRAEWFPALRGHAIPGGIVTREAYEKLVTETLDSLRKTCHTTGFSLIFMVR